jgi:RNA recognition motif-containing protein
MNNERTVFIGNITPDATNSELFNLLSRFVPLVGVKIAVDREGNQRPFAFAELEHPLDVDRALECSGLSLHGRMIRVERVKPRR